MGLDGLAGGGTASPPSSAPGGLLLEAVRRALRQPQAWRVVAVHLSALSASAARPHHRRIARAMLDETALRLEGQVFAPAGGDLVLLCRQDDTAGADLPALLRRLLREDADDPDALVSDWNLPAAAAPVLAYAQTLSGGDAPPPKAAPVERPAQTSRVDALAEAADAERVADLLQRQTGIVLTGRGEGLGQVRPLFREISFSLTALEGRAGPGLGALADPYLFRHLAARLDRRMLLVLDQALGHAGPLDPCRAGAPRLHVNLTLATIGSPAFAALLARIEAQGGACPGVEVSLVEAIAEPDALAEAAALLEAHGCGLVLDTVAASALLLADLSRLPAAMVKLDWSAHLPRLPPEEAAALDAAIARLGASRLVLHRADSEAAIRWGVSRGIRRFQGHHVDALLAAARLAACRHAARCTLRQCGERHAAAGMAARNACLDHALLDAGAPEVARLAMTSP